MRKIVDKISEKAISMMNEYILKSAKDKKRKSYGKSCKESLRSNGKVDDLLSWI